MCPPNWEVTHTTVKIIDNKKVTNHYVRPKKGAAASWWFLAKPTGVVKNKAPQQQQLRPEATRYKWQAGRDEEAGELKRVMVVSKKMAGGKKKGGKKAVGGL